MIISMNSKLFVNFLIVITLCSCANADCGVVSKKDWGGLDPVHVEYLPRPVGLVIIEHTASPICTTKAQCEERVRNTQEYHMDTLGFWDIGPSFLVGVNGTIYEGSGWIHVGAHTYGYNRKSIGISFIGNFNNDEPTDQMLDAVKEFLKCGVERGHLKSNYHLVGHKQLIATESPGRKLYNRIRQWPEWLEDVSSIKN